MSRPAPTDPKCGECGAAVTYLRGRWVAPDYDAPRRYSCGPFVAHRPLVAS